MVMISAHFSREEFTCRCGGTLPGCKGWLALPGLLAGLEKLRAAYYPAGLIVRSGYRCPRRNRQVGGAPDSQHVYGAACDCDYVATLAQVRSLGVFSGIGIGPNGLVRHVDVRHLTDNPTGGSTSNPTVWNYPA